MTALLATAYWPPLEYFRFVMAADIIRIEAHEHYIRQSYRNRCVILSANGPLTLSVPVIAGNHTPVKDVRISYAENWMQKHWRAITSAYGKSPYLSFFEGEIRPLYETRTELLIDLNMRTLEVVLEILRLKKNISFTETYVAQAEGMIDARGMHPRLAAEARVLSPYHQTFSDRFDFYPNLSILDLLFNEGLGTTEYFHRHPLPPGGKD